MNLLLLKSEIFFLKLLPNQKFTKLIIYKLIVLNLLFNTSCSFKKNNPPQTSKYKVEVTDSSGKKIDSSTNLVSRVEIKTLKDKNTLGLGKQSNSSAPILFSVKPVVDGYKKVNGLKIISQTPASTLLKLKNNDLITAIGQKKPNSGKDSKYLTQCLKTNKECSLTYERLGKAYKIYIYKL